MVCAAFEGRRAAHHRRDCCLAFEQQLHTGLQCQHGGLSGSCSKILLSGRLLFQDQPLHIELQGTRLLSSCCNKGRENGNCRKFLRYKTHSAAVFQITGADLGGQGRINFLLSLSHLNTKRNQRRAEMKRHHLPRYLIIL